MAKAVEIVRFTATDEEGLVRDLPAMLEGARRGLPGYLGATLARKEDGTWIDIVTWESHEEAIAARDAAGRVPGIAAWFGNIGEVVSVEHAEIADVE